MSASRSGSTASDAGTFLELVHDDRTITLSIEALRRDLTCPVCLELVKQATATECLHRFCTDCIEKSLRIGYDIHFCAGRAPRRHIIATFSRQTDPRD